VEQMLASPADAVNILKLYELRREPVMRQARAWLVGEFWPSTAEEYFAVADDFTHPHNAHLRQVVSYWEMAAALVIHGAVSAELFVDCNGEGMFILAKFAHILEAIRARNPTFMIKTSELLSRFSGATQRYEATLKRVEGLRTRMAARQG
jgi:hypothetical protein